MNRRTQTTKIFFTVLSLFVLGCILVSPKTTADPATAVGVTDMPPPTKLANTATLSPTDVPTATATVYPPVFDPKTLGDNRELDSFILTTHIKRTEDGEVVVDTRETFGFIEEPFSVYKLRGDSFATYVIGDRSYDRINGGMGWSFQIGPDQGLDILQSAVDWYNPHLSDLESAQFVGQEDFGGIPANHFTFDQSDFRVEDPARAHHEWKEVQGEIYLAQGGNYLLYFHSKTSGTFYAEDGTSNEEEGEITEELSSINQLTEIAVPSDYLASNLVLDPSLPLPEGTTLVRVVHYNDNFAVDHYGHTASVSRDDFLEFYTNLTPTNGWAVTHIGEITNHVNCGSEVCVIINKGNTQIILFHSEGQDATGTYYFIGADHDTLHRFDDP